MAKEKRIVATGYAILGTGIGGPSQQMAPGDYVLFDEENESHKVTAHEIETGRVTALEIQEVDVKDGDTTSDEPDVGQIDDVIQAPARALEQEVREAAFEGEKDAKQPKEAKEGAKEVEESVEAEQERQAAEVGDDEGTSGASRRGRSSRRG